MADTLDVLLEDNHCIAVAKPAGLLTQGPSAVPSLEAMVKAYIQTKYRKPGNVYLGVPHRLDRPVSGVVLFARNSKAAQRLAEQFRERQVVKLYWGAVEGTVEPNAGIWEDCLRKIPDQARAERADANAEGAKPAQTGYAVVRHFDQGTLLQYHPLTGRMHQIRLQSALHGHPLFGDVLYGSTRRFGEPIPCDEGMERKRTIALHARSLTFLHPLRYEPVTLTAALPAIWHSLGIALE